MRMIITCTWLCRHLPSGLWLQGLLLAAGMVAMSSPAHAADEYHYPAVPVASQDSAQPLRQLTIEGALEPDIFKPVLVAFHARHPNIDLTFRNLDTRTLYARYRERPRHPDADLVMSSAMPWQYLLANNGHADSLANSIDPQWPDWARWRNELVGLSFEPVAIVYRRELAARFGAPTSHTELVRLLTRHRSALKGRVVTYDPANSDTGFTFAVEDARLSPEYWALVSALGGVQTDLATSTSAMLQGIADGRYLIGYNLIGSYAYAAAARNPDLVVQLPTDYALVNQRLALIPRHALHPDTARLFLDFYTHRTGQRLVAEQTPLGALSPAVAARGSAEAFRAAYGDVLRPIKLGPGLLALVDPLKRDSVILRWQREFERPQPVVSSAPANPPPAPSRSRGETP